jgi:hypothetical protein
VVVKARPFEERIAGCAVVQAALGAAGFPCPALIAGPVRVDGLAVIAETLIPGGDQLSPAYGAMPVAALLARLIASAPPLTSVPSLRPRRPGRMGSPGSTPVAGSRRQVQMAWAAGLWVRLFNAKKDASDGDGPQLERLAGEIAEACSGAGSRRLRLASPRTSRLAE